MVKRFIQIGILFALLSGAAWGIHFFWRQKSEGGPLAQLAKQTTRLFEPASGYVLLEPKDQKACPKVEVKVGKDAYEVWDTKNRPTIFVSSQPVKVSGQGELYVGINYLDEGYGQVKASVLGEGDKAIAPDRFLDLQRTDSGKLVTGRMRFTNVSLAAGTPLGIRVSIDSSRGSTLQIEKIWVQDKPFDDPKFAYVISDPWIGPPQGEFVPAKDNDTLAGKVMVGYQGWFRTPNDFDGRGFFHWGDTVQGHFCVDMWPDNSEYPSYTLEKAGNVELRSGMPAYVFSSTWPEVVDVHFRWMREHNIDGAYLQRFFVNSSAGRKPEWVLANVRKAAHRHGRIWAIEYDVSGGKNENVLQTLQEDWKWLVDKCGILKDPNYARDGGKPVVFIWGLSVPGRNYSPDVANQVIDFFKNDPKYGGNYVIGGGHATWRKMSPEWQDHFKKHDSMLVWMSQAFEQDVADFRKMGVAYYPHVKPGFSWANMMRIPTGDPTAYTPRDGGNYYWKQLSAVAKSGADRLFVGMFDEYDESTAIMPMSDDAPRTPVELGVNAEFAWPLQGGDRTSKQKFLPTLELSLDKPAQKDFPTENYTVKITGQILAPSSGSYILSVEGAIDDAVELSVEKQRIISVAKMSEPVVTAKLPVRLEAGRRSTFRLEYTHRTNPGMLRLLWEAEGMARQPIPPSAFQFAWGRFLDNEGRDPKWWLKLTGEGRAMLRKERAPDSPMPTK